MASRGGVTPAPSSPPPHPLTTGIRHRRRRTIGSECSDHREWRADDLTMSLSIASHYPLKSRLGRKVLRVVWLLLTIQCNPLSGSQDNDSIRLIVQDFASLILYIYRLKSFSDICSAPLVNHCQVQSLFDIVTTSGPGQNSHNIQ